MKLRELIDFATGDRDEDDPDRNCELEFEIKISRELRGDPYPLEVASIDYTTRTIWLY